MWDIYPLLIPMLIAVSCFKCAVSNTSYICPVAVPLWFWNLTSCCHTVLQIPQIVKEKAYYWLLLVTQNALKQVASLWVSDSALQLIILPSSCADQEWWSCSSVTSQRPCPPWFEIGLNSAFCKGFDPETLFCYVETFTLCFSSIYCNLNSFF